jgi:hypothetical protein
LNICWSALKSWVAPRALFDAAIEYLAHQKIAIPAYSTLQKIVSQVINQHQQRLYDQIMPLAAKA